MSDSLQGRLRGKSALVTGSTSGIGLGIAEALVAEGAHTMVHGFGDAASIEARRKRLGARGVRVGYSGADVSSAADVVAMIEHVRCCRR